MIAGGRKEKLKWSQDPQNCHWSRDKSKFGYRMLQQMGWQEGKGLGSKEDGGTRHIKITKKRDNGGLGIKRSRDDEWIEHQDAFDKVLADLNATCGKESSTDQSEKSEGASTAKTLVENAMEAKKIVYKRFLRSKDLSAQSEEDLDCVFGRKKRRKTDKVEELQVNSEASSHGVTTITNVQSMQDYFAEKMKARTHSDTAPTTQEKTIACEKRKGRTSPHKKVAKKGRSVKRTYPSSP